ncbi:hypothetical protein [Sulfoacidibacillus thermotolerans]|uniref:Uncharacterized protein n=1 Tax=Sulfoacidibacillus thermotolerans TaxID=1765684 RepID=A0A2U3D6J4_SULT2|nr:hypothetical protein [Sulfoacidibacillus thermotolerans]PWI56894.1 hypothetical protein BM613_11260 [Sulfoacidibacillus thermotolerans]
MGKGLKLWVIWLLALSAGIYGTAVVYQGITTSAKLDLLYGIPILLLGIWVTGNIWASARQAYRRQRIH